MASPATRTALKLNQNTSGSWQWSSHGREIASIGYVWWSGERRLILRYVCNSEPVTQTILVTRSTPHFGGERMWFTCPFTGRSVRALYLPPGAKRWGSRHTYDLTYQSRRDSHAARGMLKLLLRLGRWPGDPAAAQDLMRDPDPFGFKEEQAWQRREKARAKRNEVRRIVRRQRRT